VSCIVQLMLLLLPWRLRCPLLVRVLGWRISPGARIGWSLLAARQVILGPKACIGHFNTVRAIEALHLAEGAVLGSWNWIGGAPLHDTARFRHCADRRPRLVLGPGAAVTSRHVLDCSDGIEIGAFSILAGYRSQILTHGIDITSGCQRTGSVRIGERCMIGSGAMLLAGVEIADRVIVAAGAVVTEPLTTSSALYGGVPARLIKRIDPEATFFVRAEAFVA
jgi:acetyltransferase-like isoleucine patch superfamily enzyme